MNQDRDAIKEEARQELWTHLFELQDRVLGLLASRDAFSVYNEVAGLKSLIGQIDSAARRYRAIS